jgi:threonine aldolase
MRQAGIIAAAGVYALQHHVERLAEDHDNARHLAEGLAEIEGITVEPVETNMVYFDVSGLGLSASRFGELTLDHGLRFSPETETRVRAVTHLDVSRTQIEEALRIVRNVAADASA